MSDFEILSQFRRAEIAMLALEAEWKEAHPGWIEAAPGIYVAPNGDCLEY